MLQSLINTNTFNNLNVDIKAPSHAYLFYGEDSALNIEMARVFIASIFCGKIACFNCESCKRVELNKNADLLTIDKINLQVADIENIIDSVQLKPMIYDYKIVFITNADTINDTAQNKLLKTLEEPNPQVIFVLACTNIDKLLPTIRSRLNKKYIPKISIDGLIPDLLKLGFNVSEFKSSDITLTDAIRYSENNELVKMVEKCITNLRSSADIPKLTSELKIKPENRKEFVKLIMKAINCALLDNTQMFSGEFVKHLQQNYKQEVLAKLLTIIDRSNKMLESNVNFNYVMDNLLYQILREKYLCK